jgi:hypothetical protein
LPALTSLLDIFCYVIEPKWFYCVYLYSILIGTRCSKLTSFFELSCNMKKGS